VKGIQSVVRKLVSRRQMGMDNLGEDTDRKFEVHYLEHQYVTA
jgi:hypothetical protein